MSSPGSPARRVRAHLRHQAVGYAALFVALGGTAGAAAGVVITSSSQVASGVIVSSHLKDGTVTGADVAADTIGSAQIANSTIKAEDLGAGAVGAPEVRPSSLGGDQIADGTLKPADLARMPGANVTHSADQVIHTGTATPLKFDSEFYDDAAMHAATDPTKLVAPVTGRYLVQGAALWSHFTDGTARSIAIRQNGTTDVARQGGFQSERSGVGDLSQQVSVTMNLQAGEFVQLVAFQTAGDDERVRKDGQASPAFSLQYLGRA